MQEQKVYYQPYSIFIENEEEVPVDVLLFGGIHPIEQKCKIRSHIRYITYQDILIQLFLQETKTDFYLYKESGEDLHHDKYLKLTTWDANGNMATRYFSFGEKEMIIDKMNIQFDEEKIIRKQLNDSYNFGTININALTNIKFNVPAKSKYTLLLFPTMIKKENFAEELYKVVSSENFQKMLSSF